jgi:hypothetical protein
MGEQVTQRSFIGGELDPGIHARADTESYQAGLALCENFIVRPQGGIESRPGTKYIDEQKSSAARGRVIPFQFNTEQAYVLLFENEVMRVIKDGGYVLSASVPYEVTTPYTTAQLSRLVFTQDADIMTITHPDHDPRRLSRTADDNWSLDVIDYTSTVDPPTTTLAITTAGTASGLPNKTYRYVITTVEDDIESLPSSELSHTINEMNTTYASRLTWDAVAGADYYRVYRDPSNGTGIYAWVGDTENAVFEDYNIAPDTSDAPPSDYLPFANSDQKPATVGYFQQREIFGNTDENPQGMFMTQLANYDSMRYSRPARTDDAIFFTIKALQVNEIRHIVGLDSLLFLTSGAVWKMTEGQDRILTPLSIGLRVQNYWGSSWTKPVVVGDSIVYVQQKGTKLRDLTYEFTDDKYRGSDLSVMADHLFRGYTIDEMAYSEEPYSVIWCVRSDGTLLGMTYHKEQGTRAWHRHESAGAEFESACTIEEDGRDATYFLVKRTVDGSTVRYIERLEKQDRSAPENVWCVDCGIRYEGSAADVITGLDHLEGETVVAVADGNTIETGLVVSGGEITLPYEAEKVTVGLAFTPAMEMLEFDTGQIVGARGRKADINNVMIEFLESRGGWVGTVDDDNELNTLYEIPARFQGDGYEALGLRTFKQDVTLDGNWERGLRVRIEQRSPMPMTILAVTPDVEFSI